MCDCTNVLYPNATDSLSKRIFKSVSSHAVLLGVMFLHHSFSLPFPFCTLSICLL